MSALAARKRVPIDDDLQDLLDSRVILHDVSWDDFEKLVGIKRDAPCPRITYLEGELELMSPSWHHEQLATLLGRLLEAYSEERGIEMNGAGSWLVRKQSQERGAEPDECYVFGSRPADKPDLVIEVIWTHGGLDKLEVYRGLGIEEVWLWRKGALTVHQLEGGRYIERPRSRFLPDLDLEKLAELARMDSHLEAVRAWRAFLRGQT